MLSRVANSIYWMNRYIERVENYARFMSVNINLSYDVPGLFADKWDSILTSTGDYESFRMCYDRADKDKIVDFMTFDLRNPNSMFRSLGEARENARTIRETLPKEVWEHLNSFYLEVKTFSEKKDREIDNSNDFYEYIKKGCQLFFGMMDATYTRNEGYQFASLGKFLERADKTSRFLDIRYFQFDAASEIKTPTPQELLIWSAVLKSVSALNMYRQQYKTLKPQFIIELLIKDRDFPRAICYCIKKAEYALYRISGYRPQDSYSNSAEKEISKLKCDIDFTETSDILAKGIHKYLDEFQTRNNRIDLEIFKTYFELESTKQ
jgi:uncharacterized alpha-E superfamily protein